MLMFADKVSGWGISQMLMGAKNKKNKSKEKKLFFVTAGKK
jgi:hypothetical protein